jgi:dienelactone hydrolase
VWWGSRWARTGRSGSRSTERTTWPRSPDAVRRLERDLRRAGHTVELHQYPGTGHWFCEPDQPAVYDVPSAARAWQRTLAFLDARLRVGG